MEKNDDILEGLDISDLLDLKVKELKKIKNDNSSKEMAIKKLEDKYELKFKKLKEQQEEAIKKIQEKFKDKEMDLKEDFKEEKIILQEEIKEQSKEEKDLGNEIISIIKNNQTGIKKSKVVRKSEKEKTTNTKDEDNSL